jgi:hypothetical protein
MNSQAKSFLISITMGALITIASICCTDLPGHLHIDRIAQAVLWPLALFEKLTGPGPRLASGGHEGSPVQLVAAVAGLGMSWAFYSCMFFLAVRYRRRNTENHDDRLS